MKKTGSQEGTHKLVFETIVSTHRDEVFEFFSRPENLNRLTPEKLSFSIITPSPIRMHIGTVIDYQLKIGFLPYRWTTLISDYNPPVRFIDVQLRGPYCFWHHTHEFIQIKEGTLIRDEICYKLKFGVLGRFLNRFFVEKDIRNIFSYRQSIIGQMFNRTSSETASES